MRSFTILSNSTSVVCLYSKSLPAVGIGNGPLLKCVCRLFWDLSLKVRFLRSPFLEGTLLDATSIQSTYVFGQCNLAVKDLTCAKDRASPKKALAQARQGVHTTLILAVSTGCAVYSSPESCRNQTSAHYCLP
eukprot:689667-Amphidinium_carterae.9